MMLTNIKETNFIPSIVTVAGKMHKKLSVFEIAVNYVNK